MKQQYTPTELQRMFVGLPQDVKDAIFSLDVSERINVVGKRNGLTVEQLGELGSEIGLILLGATAVADFTNNLAERLKISKISAAKLAENINGDIFSPIRESLKKVHGVEDLRFGSTVEEEPEKIIPPPPQPQQPLPPLKEAVPLPKKEDILQVIEDKEIIPAIFKGVVSPNAFAVKTEQEIFRNPPQKTTYQQSRPEEKQYPAGTDPYRELPI